MLQYRNTAYIAIQSNSVPCGFYFIVEGGGRSAHQRVVSVHLRGGRGAVYNEAHYASSSFS